MKAFPLSMLLMYASVAFSQTTITDLHHSDRVGYAKPSNYRSGGPIFYQAPSVAYIDSMIQNMMIGGCVDVTNIHYTGHIGSAGHLLDTTNTLGLEQGIVLTTGEVGMMAGPNVLVNTSGNNYTAGDADLSALVSASTYDAAVIEFDFIPHADTIFVADFVFGSEEYPEYVNTEFNDVFAFFIEGPGTDGPINTALIPGSNTPIAINNINNGYATSFPTIGPCVNCEYYWDNDNGDFYEFDAFTTPMHLQYPVIAGETYHFKVAIADVSDRIYDSGVIIKGHSFCGDAWFQTAAFEAQPQGGLTYHFNNQSQKSNYYVWDFGDGAISVEENPTHTYAQPGSYEVTLVASNDCFDTLATVQINALLTDVGAAENDVRQFEINPNGVGNYNLKFVSDKAEKISLMIRDMQGRLVANQEFGVVSHVNENIDMQSLSSGIYVAQLVVGNAVHVKRIVR